MNDNMPTLSTDAIADDASSVIGAAEEGRLKRMYKLQRNENINRLIAVGSLIVSVGSLIASVVSLFFSIVKA